MEKTKTKANGTLKISNEVVIKMAEMAATEIEGAASNEQKLYLGESRLAAKSPVKAHMANDSIEIDVSIFVRAGYKATSVAEAVQQNVKNAVQNMAGIVVSKVNVSIIGIKPAE